MKLDLSSLEKALASLHKAINRSQNNPQDEELRDAVIQRFEYSYELCWKMLKRRLEADAANPSEIDALNYKELIRLGAEKKLVAYPENWFDYRESRNLTAHTYDQSKAKKVYAEMENFYRDAQSLFKILEEKNKG